MMQYLLDTYTAAQKGFEVKPTGPKSDRVKYGAKGDFFQSFKTAGALLKRQKGEATKRADKAVVRENTQRLVDVTSLFLKKLPVYPWGAHELEDVFSHEAFNPTQKKALTGAFEHALVRDVKADPYCLRYRFLNPHQFRRGGKAIDVFTKVITENFDAMFAKDPRLTMIFAAQMSSIANKPAERQLFVELMVEYAPKYNVAYHRVDGEGVINDPFLKLAMWQAGTKNQALAIQLVEDRIAHLAMTGKVHEKHVHSPHVLTMPLETDDLHFDAFDAILNMVYVAEYADTGNVEFLQSTRRVFARHFDALAELNPGKAFNFAKELHGRISYFREGTALAKEADEFRNDIMGLIATNLLGKVERVKRMFGDTDVARTIMYMTDDESVQNLVVDYTIEKAKASSKYKPENSGNLLYMCEKVGNQHPRFKEMADLIVANETGNQGEIPDGSVGKLTKLASMMDGRHNRRLKVLRAATTLTEIQAQSDPLAAEKNFKAITGKCQTAAERKLAEDIETRVLPGVVSVAPMLDEDVAKMEGILARYQL